MAYRLTHLAVQGFKSLLNCSVDLTNVNVLIGPSGAGKSNVLQLFDLVRQMMAASLQSWTERQGGPDSVLSFGSNHTKRLALRLCYTLSPDTALPFAAGSAATGDAGPDRLMYSCELAPSDNTLVVQRETVEIPGHKPLLLGKPGLASRESCLSSMEYWPGDEMPGFLPGLTMADRPLLALASSCLKSSCLFHFNDTSSTAGIRMMHDIRDNLSLRADGDNLAPILYMLQVLHPQHYARILGCVRSIAPFFDNFVLEPTPGNARNLELLWQEKDSGIPFGGYLLPDGLLRFICLATTLLLPDEMLPDILLIDEPELGQHPAGIRVLTALLHAAAGKRQILVATQSASFLDALSCTEVIVAERQNGDGPTVLQRPAPDQLRCWLDKYRAKVHRHPNPPGARL